MVHQKTSPKKRHKSLRSAFTSSPRGSFSPQDLPRDASLTSAVPSIPSSQQHGTAAKSPTMPPLTASAMVSTPKTSTDSGLYDVVHREAVTSPPSGTWAGARRKSGTPNEWGREEAANTTPPVPSTCLVARTGVHDELCEVAPVPEEAGNAQNEWKAVVPTESVDNPSAWIGTRTGAQDVVHEVAPGELASKVVGATTQQAEISAEPKRPSGSQWMRFAGGAVLCMTLGMLLVMFAAWFPFRHSNKTTLAVVCGTTKPAKHVMFRKGEKSTTASNREGEIDPVNRQSIGRLQQPSFHDSYVLAPVDLSSFKIPDSIYAAGHPTVAPRRLTRPDPGSRRATRCCSRRRPGTLSDGPSVRPEHRKRHLSGGDGGRSRSRKMSQQLRRAPASGLLTRSGV